MLCLAFLFEPHVQLNSISIPSILDGAIVQQEIVADAKLQQVIAKLKEDADNVPKFSLQQGQLRYKGRLVLTKISSLIPNLLQTFHDSILGGHSEFLRTYKRMTGELYWEAMKSDIRKYVSECPVCQRNKSLAMAPAGLLLPLDSPNRIWEGISMDFIEGLPKSLGYNCILVVVDQLSKYAHFIALQHPSLLSVADAFIKNVVKLHGYPRTIVSDRDTIFLSHLWDELFRMVGVTIVVLEP